MCGRCPQFLKSGAPAVAAREAPRESRLAPRGEGPADQQRRALAIVIDCSMPDEAYGNKPDDCPHDLAREALAAKDAQLMRFRGELDSLLDALRAAVADKARAQAAVSEKLAADHLEFANEAFDVGAE